MSERGEGEAFPLFSTLNVVGKSLEIARKCGSGEYFLSLVDALVESVMRAPVTVNPSDTVSSIVDKMISDDVGAVVVVSGGVPVGIVTERDIIEKIVRVREDTETKRAEETMSSPVISVEVGTPIVEALVLMQNKRIRRLAVTRQERLVGIVTERRLLHYLYELVIAYAGPVSSRTTIH